MSGKRKKNILTIQQKLELLERHDNGETAVDLAKSYDIGVQTVKDINKNRNKLIEFARDRGNTDRKTMKKSSYEYLDVALLDWFNQQRAQGVSVSGPMCSRRAEQLFSELKLEGEFSASSGWLTRFKKRYGIGEVSAKSKTDPQRSVQSIGPTITAPIEFKDIAEGGICQFMPIYVESHDRMMDTSVDFANDVGRFEQVHSEKPKRKGSSKSTLDFTEKRDVGDDYSRLERVFEAKPKDSKRQRRGCSSTTDLEFESTAPRVTPPKKRAKGGVVCKSKPKTLECECGHTVKVTCCGDAMGSHKLQISSNYVIDC